MTEKQIRDPPVRTKASHAEKRNTLQKVNSVHSQGSIPSPFLAIKKTYLEIHLEDFFISLASERLNENLKTKSLNSYWNLLSNSLRQGSVMSLKSFFS